MELVNQTAFEIAFLPWEADPKAWRLTVIVKATFDLSPDGEATVAEEQVPPTGDEPFKDVDDDLPQSIRYPSDFAPVKPRADVMVAADGAYMAAFSRRSIFSCSIGRLSYLRMLLLVNMVFKVSMRDVY